MTAGPAMPGAMEAAYASVCTATLLTAPIGTTTAWTICSGDRGVSAASSFAAR